jgi:hypothetical protein
MTPLLAPAGAALAPAGAALAPAGAAAATAGGGREALSSLVKIIGFDRVLDLLSQKAAGAFSPATYASAGENTGKYFLGSNTYLNREQFEAEENFKRRLLGLPPVESTPEVYKRLEETRERQAENLSARERMLKELAGQIAFKQQELVGGQTFKQAQMEKEFEQARVGLERGFSLEEVKQKAIGDIEQQKYSSAYDAAKTLLNSTITAISGQGSYANNPDLRQVATPV